MIEVEAELQTLRALEEELHGASSRGDRGQLAALLHPEFLEIGRSGRRYNKVEALRELAGRTAPAPVRARDYALAVLGEGLALLTYETALVDEAGRATRHTLRSSLWVRTASGWQVRLHQGTPTSR